MRKRLIVGMALAATLALAGGYAGEHFGHPAPFPAVEQLPVASLRAGTVDAQFFGTTTLLLRDGAHAVMVDALLSRPGLRSVLFGTIAPDPARIRAALAKGRVGPVDLLLVSHSHYDHILDAAPVALATGATIVGSASAREVALGAGLPETRIRVVHGGEYLEAGAFRVTVLRSRHSAGDRVPGRITAPLRPPARADAYKEGGSYAFLVEHGALRILVHASANYVPGMYRGVRADVVFLATGGLGAQSDAFARAYWYETVEQTGAKLVVPIHWDDFLRPLDRPMLPLRRFMDDIAKGMARIAPLARRDGVTIRTMPVIAPVDLAAAIRNPQEK